MREMSEDKKKVENVIIVGGGPAGYTAALLSQDLARSPCA